MPYARARSWEDSVIEGDGEGVRARGSERRGDDGKRRRGGTGRRTTTVLKCILRRGGGSKGRCFWEVLCWSLNGKQKRE
jgi:hypothetical protein